MSDIDERPRRTRRAADARYRELHRSLSPMSMFRYYMTPETRQSLIEESNRQIAMRAIAAAARGRRVRAAGESRFAEDAVPADAAATDWSESLSESAFARLVADLEATSQAPASEARSD